MDPKEKLGKALYHLLEKKHLHDITVDEIVRDAGLTKEDFERCCKNKKELATGCISISWPVTAGIS